MNTTGRQRRGTGPGEGKRARILQFIHEFGRREGYAPSLREIGAELGLSISTVSYHLRLLERGGFLRRGAGQPRTLTGPNRPAPRADDDEAVVPLIGQIAAGVPIDAAEAAEDTFTLPRRLVGHGTLFMLRVKGDSMSGAAIADGDLVVIRQQPTARSWPPSSTGQALPRPPSRRSGAWTATHGSSRTTPPTSQSRPTTS